MKWQSQSCIPVEFIWDLLTVQCYRKHMCVSAWEKTFDWQRLTQPDFLSQTTLFIVALSPLLGFVFSNSASVFFIIPNKIKLIKRLLSHWRIAWSSESIFYITVGIWDGDNYATPDWVNGRITPGAQMAFWLQQEVFLITLQLNTVSNVCFIRDKERDIEKDKYRDYYGSSSCSLQWEQCIFQSLLAHLISFSPALVNGQNGLTLF